ncbi:UNVERIFIED_CONTAM: P-loop NTPase fold protein [Microbacterium sp. SLM126]
MAADDAHLIDNPISEASEDVLGRAVVAHDFALSLRELDVSSGIVVGVLGAWGSGKTSFVNLMREQFAEDPELAVIDFNPWLFSGGQSLTEVFFRELAAELRLTDKSMFGTIAEGLDQYGDVLSPLAIIPWFGGWFDRAFKATKAAAVWLSNKKKGSRTFRSQLTASLSSLEEPIVVVIDDIDRLTSPEIRDIFKLVRLTASFPNIIYLLAFDRVRVEQALTEEGVPGRAYLEKILQLSFDLPLIPRELLRRQIFERLNLLLDGVEEMRFDASLWGDVFLEIIDPLFGSLRDVTRFALSARPTMRALGQEIEVVDLLALEAVRVFRPELFQELHASRGPLTTTHDVGGTDDERDKAGIERLLEIADDEADLVRALIHRLFPAALAYTENNRYGSRWSPIWRRGHRVAHHDYLELYFSRTAPSDLDAFQLAERANLLLSDEAALASSLDAVPADQLEDVISALETFEEEYPQSAVVPASVTLLNRVAAIPERTNRGLFDVMTRDLVVTRVVIRLLRRLDDDEARERAVRAILSRVESFSSQELLIRSVGHHEGSGSRLIPEEAAVELEKRWAQSVVSASSFDPSTEWNLLRVYWRAAEVQGDGYVAPQLEDPDSIRALLTSARTFARSQSFGSSEVRQEPRLVWDGLIRVLGGEQPLTEAIARLRDADGETSLVLLAERYQSGWRPEEF